MLLPCGHVIAKVSMGKLARGHARNAALACELAPPSLHAVLSRPCMHTSLYLPLAASRPCVRADAYLEAHGVGEASRPVPVQIQVPLLPDRADDVDRLWQ